MKLEGRSAARIGRAFFARGAAEVAAELIGLYLVHDTAEGLVAGRIVEVEAYLPEGDAASHSYAGRTARNASMFGPPGHAYVYFVYGVHHCFNVVTGPTGRGEAVLVRAVEPILGHELMRSRRGRDRGLCDGPGKLVQAFAITRAHDGLDLVRGPLGIWRAGTNAGRALVCAGPRIGISKSRDLPLRFFSADDRGRDRAGQRATVPRVSARRRAAPRPRSTSTER